MRRLLIACSIAAAAVPVLPARAGGGGGCHEVIPIELSGTKVDLKQGCMIPNVLRAEVGDTITWTNTDPYVHTVTAGVGSWGPDELQPGASMKRTFSEPGLYPFYCRFHQAMGGVVDVGDASASEVVTGPVASDATPTASSLAIPLGVGLMVGGGAAGFTLGRRGARGRRAAAPSPRSRASSPGA